MNPFKIFGIRRHVTTLAIFVFTFLQVIPPGRLMPAAQADDVNVVWRDLVGAVANGNTLTMTAASGWGNAGAASSQSFTGDGAVRFTATNTAFETVVGLSTTNADANFTSINYGIDAVSNGIHVFEGGTYRGQFGTYQDGDLLSVERAGSTIYYKKNGTVVYTSTVAVNSATPLLADAALGETGATVMNAQLIGITPTAPSAPTNVTAAGEDQQVTLAWTAAADNGSPITGYDVQYGTVASGTFASTFTDDAVPGATITGLTNGTAYQFRVVAKNALGSSGPSDVSMATPAPVINVVWTDLVGVVANGNTLTMTAASGWGNAGAASSQTFTGDGALRFTATNTNLETVVGLSATNADANFASINYGIDAVSNGIYVFEDGIYRGQFGTYQNGDLLSVERAGNTIYYKKNGTVVYTSTVPVNSATPLLADVALYATGSTVTNAQLVGITPPVPTAPSAPTNVSASGENQQVTLAWTAAADNGSPITGYDVQYGTVASGAFASTFTDDAVPGATITGLTNGTAYQFRVVAKNALGSSGPSNVATATPVPAINVVWTDLVGVVANGNTLTMTAASGWGNAGAASSQTFTGDGALRFTATNTPLETVVGLSATNADANFASINYGIDAVSNGIYVFENGTYRGQFGTYQDGDLLSVERTGNTIYYKKNGTVVYTSTVAVNSATPLLADVALYATGATVTNAQLVGITPPVPTAPSAPTNVSASGENQQVTLAWTAAADNGSPITGYDVQYGTVASGAFASTFTDDAVPGATITGLTNGTAYQFRVVAKNALGSSGPSNVATATPQPAINVVWTDLVGVVANGNTLTMTAASGWGNAGAASSQTFTGDGALQFTATNTTLVTVVGLSATNADANYTSINYGIDAVSNGIYVFEDGIYRGQFGTYQNGDLLSVERAGNTIYYKKNGTVVYTSTVPVNSATPLLADVALYATGATVTNAQLVGITPPVPSAPSAPTNVSASGENQQVTLAWTAAADNGSPITGYDVQYGTVASGAFASTFTDDAVPGATITGLTNGTAYQFRVVAKNALGSSGPSNVATATPVPAINVVWTDLVGVVANGNTLTMTAASGWGNAGAASSQTFTGNGALRFTATDTTLETVVGLSATNADANFTSINYGIDAVSNGIYVFENGTYRGQFGTYQNGDLLSVERAGNTIYYKKNGTVVYTSTVPVNSATPLLADVALYATGSTVTNAQLVMIPVTIPTAPVLSSAVAGAQQVTLTWGAVFGATGYNVYYGTVPGVYTQMRSVGDVTQYTVTGLNAATTYYFAVTATNAAGESGKSNELNAQTPVAPTASITASPMLISLNQTSQLSWQCVNATSCVIDNGIGSVAMSGSQSTPQLANTTTYTITATGLGGTATASVRVTVLGPPDQITDLTAVTSPDQGGTVTLNWSAPNDNGSPITSYTVYVEYEYNNTTYSSTTPSFTTGTTITGLPNGVVCQFAVAAVNSHGQSNSNVTYAKPGALSVHIKGAGTGTKSNMSGTQTVDYSMSMDITVTAENPRVEDGYTVYDITMETGLVQFDGTGTIRHSPTYTELYYPSNTHDFILSDDPGTLRVSTTQCGDINVAISVTHDTVPLGAYLTLITYTGSSKTILNSYELREGVVLHDFDIPGSDDYCSVSVIPEKKSFLPGDTTELYADTNTSGTSLVWEILPRTGNSTARAVITPSADGRTAVVSDMQGDGDLVIKVSNPARGYCFTQVPLHIGCDDCCNNQGNCNVGAQFNDDHNISMRLGVGRSARGTSAGALLLQVDSPSLANATPAALEAYALGAESRIIRQDNNVRQVSSPEVMVDVVTVSPYKYQMIYYKASDVSLSNGLYQPKAGAEIFATYTVENPDNSDAVYNRLRITENRDGQNYVNEYVWDVNTQTWSLSQGNDQKRTSRTEAMVAGDRVVTETVKDNLNNTAAKTRTVYHTFTVNAQPVEEVVQVVEDPDNAALTTTTTWYSDPCQAGSCGQVAQVVEPDGSWVKYEYDSLGRVTQEIHSWLDSPVSSTASQARAVVYNYTAQDATDTNRAEDARKPRKVTESVLGQVTAETYYVFVKNATYSNRTNIVERAAVPGAVYGAAGNQRTTTVVTPYFGNGAGSWSPQTITYPDGTLDTYTYQSGIYTPNADPALPGTFTAGIAGDAVREYVQHGDVNHPQGYQMLSSREERITNSLGEVLLEKQYVYDGFTDQEIGWAVYQYDKLGRVTATSHSNGTRSETSWSGVAMKTDTDANGTVVKSEYDDLMRLGTESKMDGTTALVVKTYTYDAAGRRLTEAVTDGTLSLSSGSVYDIAGRITSMTDQAGLVTSYGYTSNGLTTTVTQPGGATEITTKYLDGRVKSVTGTAVVAQYYTYGANPDGTQWIEVHSGSPSSPVWEKTTTDCLGRASKAERPGYSGTETTQHFYTNYYAQAEVDRTTNPGMADTIYQTHTMGNYVRTGIDINHSGEVDFNSTDRITATETRYVYLNSQWWRERQESVYATDNSYNATVTAIQRTRLTGLGTPVGNAILTGESVSIDQLGNQTVMQTLVDRAGKTVTQTVNAPDSDTDEVSTTVNGLLTSTQSKTGVTMTYTYDGLERQVGVTDPRTGTAVTHYNATTGQVDYVEDAATNRTSFTYDATSGRKLTETNADNKVTRFGYDAQGHVTNVWGDAPYPVRYTFDTYGRLHLMDTWRQGSAWNATTFPTNMEASKDTTTWNYQEATGLLTSKSDAAGRSVSYTYTTGGKLATRTWARGGSTGTTYTYDANTGELLNINYADTTPDVTFTYDRLGRQSTVTDGVGSRNFVYFADVRPYQETITGLYNRTIEHDYTTLGMIGLPAVLTTGSNYTVSYGYQASTGRLNNVGWNVGGAGSRNAAYGYLANSDLLSTRTIGNQVTTYSYETARDLKTQVRNQYNSTTVSQYDYQYDAIGRRTSVANIGTAFAASAFNRFNYNDRSELAESTRYLGTDVNILTNPVPSEYRHFDYDPIGNRTAITTALSNGTYSTNNLNQYTNSSLPAASFVYDLDGNLGMITGAVGGRAYVYDAENRLISVTPTSPGVNEEKIELTYDYMGRRVQKVISAWTGSAWSYESTKQFVYDGWNLIEEVTTGMNASTKYYVWGLDLSQTTQGAGGIGGLLAKIESGETHYYLYDGNGNVGQLLSSTGTLGARYEYDPYGNTVFSEAWNQQFFNPFRFSTKYLDTESGLYYYGYRYYDPEIGRWLSRDPIEERGGVNLYTFNLNAPINNYDLFGLTTVIQILDAYFSASTIERQWIMPENDEYTVKVRYWVVVENAVRAIKNDLKQNPRVWETSHKTSQSWRPGPTDPAVADPKAFAVNVPSPAGTDPYTAAIALGKYKMSRVIPEKLWTSAIGSFSLFVTVDNIDVCNRKATMNYWMYNSMDRDSFGSYASLFPNSGQARQYMWWNWKEKYKWDKNSFVEWYSNLGEVRSWNSLGNWDWGWSF